jgi:hypothetical protein
MDSKGENFQLHLGYALDGGGLAMYLFSTRAQVKHFQKIRREELIAMERSGAQISALAAQGDIVEITVDPESNPFVIRHPQIELLGASQS